MTFKYMTIEIATRRLKIRTLVSSDNFKEYLSWMQNRENRFISSIDPSITEENLVKYVEEKNASQSAILLGIFNFLGDAHIGNLKFEPVNIKKQTAVLGVLIGNPHFRGVGIAQEAINASTKYLFNSHGIHRYLLGVRKDNLPAIRAYIKSGFNVSELNVLNLDSESHEMLLDLKIKKYG
jgi:ribosomal-protein-alanine N-acetyltransferase